MRTITKALLFTVFLASILTVKVTAYQQKPAKKEAQTQSIKKADLGTVNHLERRTFETNVNTCPVSGGLSGILAGCSYTLEVHISAGISRFFSQTFPQKEFHFYPFVAFW